LAAPNGYDRLAAAQSLGALGAVAAPAVPELARALRDPAWGDVRMDTRKRFTVMGMILMPMKQIEALGEMDQRMFLPEVLKQIGTPDVYPVLAEALADPNPVIAVAAESALEELMPACADFVRGLLDHPEEDIRRRASGILNPSTSEED
jgi:HEAT repeat protein